MLVPLIQPALPRRLPPRLEAGGPTRAHAHAPDAMAALGLKSALAMAMLHAGAAPARRIAEGPALLRRSGRHTARAALRHAAAPRSLTYCARLCRAGRHSGRGRGATARMCPHWPWRPAFDSPPDAHLPRSASQRWCAPPPLAPPARRRRAALAEAPPQARSARVTPPAALLPGRFAAAAARRAARHAPQQGLSSAWAHARLRQRRRLRASGVTPKRRSRHCNSPPAARTLCRFRQLPRAPDHRTPR